MSEEGDRGARLEAMSPELYSDWFEHLIHDYAQDKVDSGNWPREGAEARARRETTELLSDGLATPGHYLYSVVDTYSDEEVGVLWLAILDRDGQTVAFLYDIEIRHQQRRRGYGYHAIKAMEETARSLGAERIELHVFGQNTAALALYEKAGYTVSNVLMVKPLG